MSGGRGLQFIHQVADGAIENGIGFCIDSSSGVVDKLISQSGERRIERFLALPRRKKISSCCWTDPGESSANRRTIVVIEFQPIAQIELRYLVNELQQRDFRAAVRILYCRQRWTNRLSVLQSQHLYARTIVQDPVS